MTYFQNFISFTSIWVYHQYLGFSFLSENEIEQFCHDCWGFGEWYTKTFPQETLTSKFHILVFHAPLLVRQWNSVCILENMASSPYIIS